MWQRNSGSQRGASRGSISTLGSRVVGTVFFGMFFGLGLFFVLMVAREAWQGLESYGWNEQPAIIVSAEVQQQGGDDPYVPVVAFEYVFGSTTRTSQSLAQRVPRTDDYAEAAAHVARYPVGATVTCYVAPDGRAVLEHGSAWWLLAVLFPMIFVLIGGGGLYATWKPTRRDASGREIEDPISSEAKGGGGAGALVAFGALFTLIGVAIAWPTLIAPASMIWQARGWTPEQCVVEASAVRSHRSDDGTTYSVDILYRWERAGRTHRSNRYSFFGGSSSGRDGKREIVRAHPVGHGFTCWVDPNDAGQAVIERGVTTHALVAVAPIAFIAIGLFVLRNGLQRRNRRERLAEELGRGGDGPQPDDPVLEWLPEFELEHGPRRLEPETSRRTRLLGIVFACVFWNGIVAVFAHQARESFERGRPEWGLTLFLVPFVLVGIGLCFGIVYEIMRATNARAELHANASVLALGRTLEIEWRLHGRLAKLRRLTIALEGREAATYRRGTNSHTVAETFASLPLVDLVDTHRMASGRAAIELPRHTMHSFEGGDNVISWALRLEGEIDRWPDIDERYPIVVLPLPRGERYKPEDPS